MVHKVRGTARSSALFSIAASASMGTAISEVCFGVGATSVACGGATSATVWRLQPASVAAISTMAPKMLKARMSRPLGWVLSYHQARSEERRVGKAGGSTCRYRWSAYPSKKKHPTKNNTPQDLQTNTN